MKPRDERQEGLAMRLSVLKIATGEKVRTVHYATMIAGHSTTVTRTKTKTLYQTVTVELPITVSSVPANGLAFPFTTSDDDANAPTKVRVLGQTSLVVLQAFEVVNPKAGLQSSPVPRLSFAPSSTSSSRPRVQQMPTYTGPATPTEQGKSVVPTRAIFGPATQTAPPSAAVSSSDPDVDTQAYQQAAAPGLIRVTSWLAYPDPFADAYTASDTSESPNDYVSYEPATAAYQSSAPYENSYYPDSVSSDSGDVGSDYTFAYSSASQLNTTFVSASTPFARVATTILTITSGLPSTSTASATTPLVVKPSMTSNASDRTASSHKASLSQGAIVGVVLAVLAGLAVVILLVICCGRRRQNRQTKSNHRRSSLSSLFIFGTSRERDREPLTRQIDEKSGWDPRLVTTNAVSMHREARFTPSPALRRSATPRSLPFMSRQSYGTLPDNEKDELDPFERPAPAELSRSVRYGAHSERATSRTLPGCSSFADDRDEEEVELLASLAPREIFPTAATSRRAREASATSSMGNRSPDAKLFYNSPQWLGRSQNEPLVAASQSRLSKSYSALPDRDGLDPALASRSPNLHRRGDSLVNRMTSSFEGILTGMGLASRSPSNASSFRTANDSQTGRLTPPPATPSRASSIRSIRRKPVPSYENLGVAEEGMSLSMSQRREHQSRRVASGPSEANTASVYGAQEDDGVFGGARGAPKLFQSLNLGGPLRVEPALMRASDSDDEEGDDDARGDLSKSLFSAGISTSPTWPSGAKGSLYSPTAALFPDYAFAATPPRGARGSTLRKSSSGGSPSRGRGHGRPLALSSSSSATSSNPFGYSSLNRL